ncbi:M-phase inducer phosphatase-like [Ostrea edulis]|uniref:M-phase inducer phosphatase-like n=1 Tax=Ostrea edulis TaxID=37623 RepID=UPI0024AED954|nr:M-phase inducer phosphatase-like [Ostrea edulis]
MSNIRNNGRPSPLQQPLRTIATSNTIQNLLLREKSKMNSPMSNLAMNLSELSTGRGTPKRKLSLSSIDTPPACTSVTQEQGNSSESGCFVDSPTLLDSPTLEMSLHRFAKAVKPEIPVEAFTKKKTISFRRIQSMPLPMMRLSPVDFPDKENDCSVSPPTSTTSPVLSPNSEVSPPIPSARSPQMSIISKPKFFLDENSSQDSGVCLTDRVSNRDFANISLHPQNEISSPLKTNTILNDDDDDEKEVDDGFLDSFMDQEVAEINDNIPSSLCQLFSAPVLNSTAISSNDPDNDTPIIRRTQRRLLQRSQSTVESKCRLSSKRDRDENTPIQSKRRRPVSIETTSPPEESHQKSLKPKLHRCHSESEAMIKSALNRIADEPDLIGDCSKPYCLPTIPGKHSDLKAISSETLSRVLSGEFDHVIEQAIVVDCRYPYEYEGGHIRGAKHVYTKEAILDTFLATPLTTKDPEKRNILIFHCEFSSERGPNLCRFLRKYDRDSNKDCYPHLHYPELYLLEGGYKNFFEKQKNFCEPQTYKPMLHKDHSDDLRHFRLKSKSWAGEKTNRPGFRPLKF